MKKKQVQQRQGKLIKKRIQTQNGVEDLATYEEDEINSMHHTQQFEKPKQKQPQQVLQQEEDEEEEYNIDDIKKSAEKKQNQDKISEIVLSLFHKNKINDKNAFDIPLIDIKDLSVFSQTEGDNAWKLISANLDAGSKIYGYRVDMVHQDTYRVLGGIHRTATNFDENQEQAVEQEQEQIKKRKIINTGGESTLEKNIANLDTNKYDLEFEIDPLFQQTSAKFDEAGAKGLLLNNLSISENLVLALDSELLHETNNREKQILANNNFNSDVLNCTLNNIFVLALRNNLKTILNSELCPELAQFRSEILLRGQELFDLKNLGTHFVFIVNLIENDVMRNNPAIQMDEQEEFIMDDQQEEEIFMQEVDQIAGEQNANYMSNTNQNYMNEHNNKMQEQAHDQEYEDYHFQPSNHKYTLSHEKKKNFNLKQFEGAIQQIGTGKIFNSENERLDWMNFEMGGKLNKKKLSGAITKPTKLKRRGEFSFSFNDKEVLTRASVFQKKQKEANLPYLDHKQLYLLPRPHQVESQNFSDLFQRDCLRVLVSQTTVEDEYEVQEQLQQNDEFMQEDHQLLNSQKNPGTQTNTQRVTIPIKELKIKMWQALNQKIPLTNQKEGFLFSRATSLLPQILQIPHSRMNVSVQTCFVTMLHLANEENLRFLGYNQETDFEIQKEII